MPPAATLFVDVALARRIENAECRMIIDLAEAAARTCPDIFVGLIAGGAAVFTGLDSPTNKLAGLGFGGCVNEEELGSIEREFDRRSAPVQVELSTLADNSLAAMLTRRGYILVGFENVLGMRLAGNAAWDPATEQLDVREADPAEVSLWIGTLITGFSHPDSVEGITPHESFERDAMAKFMGIFADAPGFRRYLAYRNGVPAGGASLRLGDRVALLCGAATLPAHRRRGVQTALLRSRLGIAASEGCDIAVMTVQPGSKSHENGARQGFSLLYARAILRRDPR